MQWIYVRHELPKEGQEVFIIRGWEGSKRYPVKACRHSSKPLTINEDMSRDCWWFDVHEGSSFSDATVIAWLKIPEPIIPAFEGVEYEFPRDE